MTQKAMADVLQVSKRTVESWESGVRNIPEPMMVLTELLRDVPAVRKRLMAA
jgi:DNA-binding transcriptional regulator YiaG